MLEIRQQLPQEEFIDTDYFIYCLEAVDNIDEIVNQDGIDCLFIGTADLAVSLDCEEINDSRVIDAIDRVIRIRLFFKIR